MSDHTAITLYIMGNDISLRCQPEQSENLKNAAKLVEEKIKTIQQSGKIISTERVAILVALELACEKSNANEQKTEINNVISERISHLYQKITDKIDI